MAEDMVAKLKRLQTDYASKKDRYNQLVGQRDALLQNLQSVHGVSTIEEAKAKMQSLLEKNNTLSMDINTTLNTIETMLAAPVVQSAPAVVHI